MNTAIRNHSGAGGANRRKSMGCVLLAMLLLLCNGCGIDYENTPAAQIIRRTIRCSEGQAQEIQEVLTNCGATRLQSIKQTSTTQYDLQYPEGVLWLQVDQENNLRQIAGRSDTAMYLFRDKGYLGLLIETAAERQYYADTTESMVRSIEDRLTTVSFIGKETVPESFEYAGDVFSYCTLDGIVHVSFTIYGVLKDQKVKFQFKAEYAMLHPVSLKLNSLKLKEDEQIDYVWQGAIFQMPVNFDRLREQASVRAAAFTEDEINHAKQIIKEYEEYRPAPREPLPGTTTARR